MTLEINGKKHKREIDLLAVPTVEGLQEAEQYIFDLIDGGLDLYREKKAKKETNRRLHLYFGHSKNDELKRMWSEFIKPITDERIKVQEDAVRKLFADHTKKAKANDDTYEAKYEIITDHGDRLFIGMEKSSNGKNKTAFGYGIEVDQKETPEFFKYCKDHLPRHQAN